uniref:Uncharacterized protein n=1 Tax=Chenopodium quinoa TaxID=63459 RepID=A0A803MKI9_CHEQI
MASRLSVGSGSSRFRSRGNSSPAIGVPPQRVCTVEDCSLVQRRGKGFMGEQKTCGFFNWADEVDDVRDLQQIVIGKEETISDLEHQVDMLKQEMEVMRDKVKKSKAKNEKLFEKVEEMGIATTETMFELNENNTDKRLMLTLVFSWAFFTLVLMLK